MKKLFALLLMLFGCFTVAACGDKEEDKPKDDTPGDVTNPDDGNTGGDNPGGDVTPDPISESFDALTEIAQEADNSKDKTAYVFASDSFFTSVGTVQTRYSGSGKVQGIEMARTETVGSLNGVTFTVDQTVTLVVAFTSTGGSNLSEISVLDENGEFMEDSTGSTRPTALGTTSQNAAGVPATFELEAGTYTIVSFTAHTSATDPATNNTFRGARIISISVATKAV